MPPPQENLDKNSSADLFKKPTDDENLPTKNRGSSNLNSNNDLNQGQSVALQKLATLQALGESLVMPKFISDANNDLQRMQVLQMLQSLDDVALAQTVLDELAGAIARGNIKMPTKLLAKFVTDALNGEFIPDAAIAVKQSRNRANAHQKAMAENQTQSLAKATLKSTKVKFVPPTSARQVLDNLNQQTESHSHVS